MNLAEQFKHYIYDSVSFWRWLASGIAAIIISYTVSVFIFNNDPSLLLKKFVYPEKISFLDHVFLLIGIWVPIFFLTFYGVLQCYLSSKSFSKFVQSECKDRLNDLEEKHDEKIKDLERWLNRDVVQPITNAMNKMGLTNREYLLTIKAFKDREQCALEHASKIGKSLPLELNQKELVHVKIYVISRDIKVTGVKDGFTELVRLNISNEKINYGYLLKISPDNSHHVRDTLLALRCGPSEVDILNEQLHKQALAGFKGEPLYVNLVKAGDFHFPFDFVIFEAKYRDSDGGEIEECTGYQEMRIPFEQEEGEDAAWLMLHTDASKEILSRYRALTTRTTTIGNNLYRNYNLFKDEIELSKSAITNMTSNEDFW